MHLSYFIEILYIINRLIQNLLSHLFEERVHIQLSLKYSLFSTIVIRTHITLMLSSHIIEIFGILFLVSHGARFHYILHEYLLLILSKLFLLLSLVHLSFLYSLNVFWILLIQIECIQLMRFSFFLVMRLFDLFTHPIHDTHQSFLMASEIYFLRIQ